MTKEFSRRALAVVVLLGCAFAPGPASAADTLELFDEGPSDLELYLGVSGIGQRAEERAFDAEWVLGFGLAEWVSAYVSGSYSADGDLVGTENAQHVGAYATLLDGPHLDWDLGFEAGGDGTAGACGPFLELNLDREPELASMGLYTRLSAEVYGRPGEDSGASPGTRLSAVVGGYLSLGLRHQLLLEVDGAWNPRPGVDEVRREMGAAHLGYNVIVADSLELINEVALDVPGSEEEWAWGGFTGFIASFGP